VGSDHRRLYHQLDVPVGSGPNLLALALVKSIVGINISWGTWFIAFLPLGILLILAMPLLAYWFYPPEVKVNNVAAVGRA
jgi:di/tricarboxylate transporter